MPRTVNGFGTRFYGFFGTWDRHSDGSYITTEWVVLFFLPVIPIKSFRVFREGESAYGASLMTVQRLPKLHWKQVLATYAGVLLYMLWSAYWASSIVGEHAAKDRTDPYFAIPAIIFPLGVLGFISHFG